ncbi:hypothetical protein GYMLUDRAFT_78390 [Collybiopsis luxurians FD-317 M1]|uniref:Uncharacterized protein n=1 Tax=Collybiopsis luxurians FD-317 M1 TaxID=944289 RepID=A0A0D0C051_9AGAR|nr:hypothetical protein GYMLUDRAFT_78390 [Collybiopsis luxurians FD-317 M1]
MQSECRDLLDYDNLGNSGICHSLKSTLGKLSLAESEDPSQLFAVPQMFHVPLILLSSRFQTLETHFQSQRTSMLARLLHLLPKPDRHRQLVRKAPNSQPLRLKNAPTLLIIIACLSSLPLLFPSTTLSLHDSVERWLLPLKAWISRMRNLHGLHS